MTTTLILMAGVGVLILLTAWIPLLLKDAPLSLPIICVAIGAAIFWTFDLPTLIPDDVDKRVLVEGVSTVVVIVALMGAGLKIDQRFGLWSWGLAWRLLLVAMPLTIFALFVLGYGLMGLSAAAALLLAAALAPTDPVLASDVEVGPPQSGEEDETRFALTAEAGLNDGLAFPFVMASVALALSGQGGDRDLLHWVAVDIVYRLVAGTVAGIGIGSLLGWLIFRIPKRANLSRTGDGFVALGVTFIAYALTELIYGYGFVAVFVAGLTLRAVERDHEYHTKLHDFIEQFERLLMMVFLVGFGGAIASAGLLASLTWPAVIFALFALFVVRPLSGWISLTGSGVSPDEKAAISFFGIRGIGSAYYLAFALGAAPFDQAGLLISTASLIVLVSIILHGVTVTPIMKLLDRRRDRMLQAPISSRSISSSSH